MSIEREISLINRIIAESILHGADAGGSYDSNREWLFETINDWIKEKGLEGKYKIIDSYYIRKELLFFRYSTLKIVPINYIDDKKDWFN